VVGPRAAVVLADGRALVVGRGAALVAGRVGRDAALDDRVGVFASTNSLSNSKNRMLCPPPPLVRSGCVGALWMRARDIVCALAYEHSFTGYDHDRSDSLCYFSFFALTIEPTRIRLNAQLPPLALATEGRARPRNSCLFLSSPDTSERSDANA